MTKDIYDTPLNDDEFIEIGELLAQIPEPFEPMEADTLDGYLSALLVFPEEVGPAQWMPYVFDVQGREASLENPRDQERLEELVYRRYRSLDADLAHSRKIDPIIYPVEDDRGHEVRGYDGISAATPFALGFYEAYERWPELKDSEDPLISSALLGIFRYLPEELLGDLAPIVNELNLESPIENLDQAIDDMALSVAEIAHSTRGFALEKKSTGQKTSWGVGKGNRKKGMNRKHY